MYRPTKTATSAYFERRTALYQKNGQKKRLEREGAFKPFGDNLFRGGTFLPGNLTQMPDDLHRDVAVDVDQREQSDDDQRGA